MVIKETEVVGFVRSFNKRKGQYCYLHKCDGPVQIFSKVNANEDGAPEILLVQKDDAWKSKEKETVTIITDGHIIRPLPMTDEEFAEATNAIRSESGEVNNINAYRFQGGDFIVFSLAESWWKTEITVFKTKYGWYKTQSPVLSGIYTVLNARDGAEKREIPKDIYVRASIRNYPHPYVPLMSDDPIPVKVLEQSGVRVIFHQNWVDAYETNRVFNRKSLTKMYARFAVPLQMGSPDQFELRKALKDAEMEDDLSKYEEIPLDQLVYTDASGCFCDEYKFKHHDVLNEDDDAVVIRGVRCEHINVYSVEVFNRLKPTYVNVAILNNDDVTIAWWLALSDEERDAVRDYMDDINSMGAVQFKEAQLAAAKVLPIKERMSFKSKHFHLKERIVHEYLRLALARKE